MINKVGRFCLAKGVKLVWLFHYGEIYAIVTTNEMRTVKRIGPSSNSDNYTLIPTNKSPEYGIQELPKNMILRIFEVMGCMKRL